MNRNAGLNKLGNDRCLEVGEGQDEIRIERKDLRNVRRRERRHSRLFASHLGRTYRITRHADDAVLLAEQIERFDCLFGQTDDP